ncbi:MAG TPA: hypothetical protein VM434_10065 [Beijerinckiaceae bacterium]|nr:hypothetical protein [Beijerinckiaceae bacterium]
MPIVLFLLLILLVAQLGFWDAMGAVLGAAAMVMLFFLLIAAIAAGVIYMLVNRVRSRIRGPERTASPPVPRDETRRPL